MIWLGAYCAKYSKTLFTVYLITQGVSPKEHGIKHELVYTPSYLENFHVRLNFDQGKTEEKMY